jgi:hypothetical protein
MHIRQNHTLDTKSVIYRLQRAEPLKTANLQTQRNGEIISVLIQVNIFPLRLSS